MVELGRNPSPQLCCIKASQAPQKCSMTLGCIFILWWSSVVCPCAAALWRHWECSKPSTNARITPSPTHILELILIVLFFESMPSILEVQHNTCPLSSWICSLCWNHSAAQHDLCRQNRAFSLKCSGHHKFGLATQMSQNMWYGHCVLS